MPINVKQGTIIEFSVVFFDSTGNVTVPSSGSMTVVYTATSGSTASTLLNLNPVGNFFTSDTWNSTIAALGFVNYSANAPGEVTTPAANGQIRLTG